MKRVLDFIGYMVLVIATIFAIYSIGALVKYVYEGLLREINASQVTIEEYNNKPTYAYLRSVSLYLFHQQVSIDDKVSGSVGTGVIVSRNNGYFYILTNKHICANDDENCYVVTDGDLKFGKKLKLTYVASAEDKDIDLELWKIEESQLPDKQEIKRVKQSYPQDRIYNVGNYLGFPFIYSEGTNAGMETIYDLYNLSCAPGCSGSGVFNQKGELVGLIFAGNPIPTTFPLINSFDTSKVIAVSATDIKDFLDEVL